MNAKAANPGTERKKPGRKSETPAQRLERLEREMTAARRAVAEAEQMTLATVGQAMIAEAESDPAFMARLRDVIRARVTSKPGKAAVAALLAPSPGSAEEAPAA